MCGGGVKEGLVGLRKGVGAKIRWVGLRLGAWGRKRQIGWMNEMDGK